VLHDHEADASAPHDAEGHAEMTISPGPPPWPIPPSWTLSPREPRTPRPAPEPPSAAPAGAATRTVVVLCPDGSGARAVLDTLRAAPGVTLEARAVSAPVPGFPGVYDLARAAGQAVSEGAHGVVVAQATDAPEETAWALELLHTGDTPLVIAADPHHAGDVADAIGVAAGELSGFGCVLVTHGEIHAARHVRRAGATTERAFASPAAGPLGHVADGAPRLLWRPPGRITLRGPHGTGSPQVGLHTIALGDDGRLLRAIAEHCDGLVVAAPGTGRVPEPVTPILAELAGRVPVVLAAPAAWGGALPATTLDPLKARILMYLLLAAGRDREAVIAAFAAADHPDGTEL
jgi:L-asparaginase